MSVTIAGRLGHSLKKRKRCVHPYSVIRDFVEMRSPADSNAQAEIA